METFTVIHVIISLIGIASGLVVIFGFLTGARLPIWNALFLVMTIATSVTGFFFPFKGITPGIVVGILSLIILALALAAYRKHWTRTYIFSATLAEFLNVVVLIVQSFQKIPALHQLAPIGTEPVVKAVQGLALIVFVAMAIIAVRRSAYRLE